MTRWLDARDPERRPEVLGTAASLLRRGRLVVIPLETGYALAADAFNSSGTAAIRAAQDLAGDTALSVIIGRRETVDGIAHGIPVPARRWMADHWPGLLTLVVAPQPSLRWGAGRRRFAVRMPMHPVALFLAREVGPVAVSALQWRATPVLDPGAAGALPPGVDAVVDAGQLASVAVSTVIDVTAVPAALVRTGDIDPHVLEGFREPGASEDMDPIGPAD